MGSSLKLNGSNCMVVCSVKGLISASRFLHFPQTKPLSKYLQMLKCASGYIQDIRPDFWGSVKVDIDYAVSHLGGWEGTEQNQMRWTAVLARLIPWISHVDSWLM